MWNSIFEVYITNVISIAHIASDVLYCTLPTKSLESFLALAYYIDTYTSCVFPFGRWDPAIELNRMSPKQSAKTVSSSRFVHVRVWSDWVQSLMSVTSPVKLYMLVLGDNQVVENHFNKGTSSSVIFVIELNLNSQQMHQISSPISWSYSLTVELLVDKRF